MITTIDCLKCKGCEHPEKELVKHPHEVLVANQETGTSRVINLNAPSSSFIPSCLNIKSPERIVKIRKANNERNV